MTIIRRARQADAKGIHDAHMRSIQVVCSRDHSSEEIRAWSGRPYREDQWRSAISNHSVCVVEADATITAHGFYKAMGFKDTGDQILTEIADVGIRSYPMELQL